jgi:N,N'-diacetyllegionaminate synthase
MKFSQTISIGTARISKKSPPFIIAEAGVNHNGDMGIAKKMIDAAVEMGANAVKFQAFKTENLILPQTQKATYQVKTTGSSESQFQMLKQLELPVSKQAELSQYSNEKGLVFLTTPFDEATLDELDMIDLPAYKVSSTDVTNLPFLLKIAKKNKPILLSTGMCSLDELETVLNEILAINNQVILLQCTANYPVADDEVNLSVISRYCEHFDCLIGFSDHTEGTGAAPYAATLGACVIEKHFTLDREMPGPDHVMSLLPDEFRSMVQMIRQATRFLGTGEKALTKSEVSTRNYLQKCLVAAKYIAEGEAFTEYNIIGKRTGGRGISTLRYKEILGRTARRHFYKDEIIEL